MTETWTTNNTLYCAYCGHELSTTFIVYVDGQPVCAMCRAKMEGLRRGPLSLYKQKEGWYDIGDFIDSSGPFTVVVI